jgi:hypothetical protein
MGLSSEDSVDYKGVVGFGIALGDADSKGLLGFV